MTKNQRSYTTVDVAKRLGVSLQTVQRWVDAGHLKAWKTIGGHRRIEASSAELLFTEQEHRIGATTNAHASRAETTALSVVVVEDDPLHRELLVMLVRKAIPNAAIEAAANGFQGLVAIGKMGPDLVVTDIHMPYMDGFEMIRTLMDDRAIGPVKVIAVTALSTRELAAAGTLPPEVQVFTKPLDNDRFVAALRAALG